MTANAAPFAPPRRSCSGAAKTRLEDRQLPKSETIWPAAPPCTPLCEARHSAHRRRRRTRDAPRRAPVRSAHRPAHTAPCTRLPSRRAPPPSPPSALALQWMRHRSLSDARFDASAAHAGLCPIDLGVHVLEGVLLAFTCRAERAAAASSAAGPSSVAATSAAPDPLRAERSGGAAPTADGGGGGSSAGGSGGTVAVAGGGTVTAGGAAAWAKQLGQLREALAALIVTYEGTAARRPPPAGASKGASRRASGGGLGGSSSRGRGRAEVEPRSSRDARGGRGFSEQRGAAITAPALSDKRGVVRELLAVMDLQHGIRYGSQLQTAKVFVVAVEQLLAQLGEAPSPSRPPPRPTAGGGAGGRGSGGSGRTGKGRAKRAKASRRLTKRERRAFEELARDGLVGLGAVDPSPQRTTVAVAASISLLLLEPNAG